MRRPDCVRAGDEETERLLARAFRAGFYTSIEGWDGEYGAPSGDELRESYEEWRRSLLTREVPPPLSSSQIDALICLVRGEQPDDVDGGPWELSDAPDELLATLRALRTEMTREDDDATA